MKTFAAMILKRSVKVPSSEFSKEFVQKMLNAMSLSFFKYGRVADAYPVKVNAIDSLKLRLQKYLETGNTEYLVDVANFAMIEFMHPRHPNAHYKAEDSGESPGRVWNRGGAPTEAANTLGQENLRRGGSHLTTTGGFYKREGD